MDKKIVILTGAGISAESGIKTFRDQDGLWENHKIEDVASPEGFRFNPDLVYEFYNLRRAQLLSDEVQPNRAHLALARLQENYKGSITLVTQNVDNLHERGGSKNVIHMHGELMKMRCQNSLEVFSALDHFDGNTNCDCCKEPGHLRPHIVWFGEMPLYMHEINAQLNSCDIFISIGTSGLVYPAAMFVDMVPRGATKIEVNLDETQISDRFDKHYIGQASQQVEKLIDDLLNDLV